MEVKNPCVEKQNTLIYTYCVPSGTGEMSTLSVITSLYPETAVSPFPDLPTSPTFTPLLIWHDSALSNVLPMSCCVAIRSFFFVLFHVLKICDGIMREEPVVEVQGLFPKSEIQKFWSKCK